MKIPKAIVHPFGELPELTDQSPNKVEKIMRNLILQDIENLRAREQGFDRRTMRWSGIFLTDTGMESMTRKEAKRRRATHISEATSEDFAKLGDTSLLDAYKLLYYRAMKQM